MECDDIDWFMSYATMDPLILNNTNWTIDWSLVNPTSSVADFFNDLQFSDTDKIATQNLDIP